MEKRKLLLLLCMLLSLAVQAQTATGHLKFKGVPMDGPVDEFVEKIKGTDLQVVDKFDDATMLPGHSQATVTARFLYILQRGTATSAWSA